MQLSKPHLLLSHSLESDWIVIWSDFGSNTILTVLSMGKLARSRFITFGEMSSFGKVFKIPIELDVHFVTRNPTFFNNDDTDNIVDTAVGKLLKQSK